MTMDKYLIHYNGKGRIVELSTRETTSDQFGEMQKSFAIEAGRKEKDWGLADMIRLYPDQFREGVFYSWGLAGPDGAWFDLIKFPDTTAEMIMAAAASLRQSRDVVSLSVTRISAMI